MKIDTSARAETWRSLKMTGNLTNVDPKVSVVAGPGHPTVLAVGVRRPS